MKNIFKYNTAGECWTHCLTQQKFVSKHYCAEVCKMQFSGNTEILGV